MPEPCRPKEAVWWPPTSGSGVHPCAYEVVVVAVVEAQEDAKRLFSQTHSCRSVESVLVSILSGKKAKSRRVSEPVCGRACRAHLSAVLPQRAAWSPECSPEQSIHMVYLLFLA